jgi:hypothetical protein
VTIIVPLMTPSRNACMAAWRIKADKTQRAAPRPASFFNSRPGLAEMKLHPARPATRSGVIAVLDATLSKAD